MDGQTVSKVQIFWEGRKILRNLPLTFDNSTYTVLHTVKSKGKISQNFLAFSEYMNFNTYYILYFAIFRV